MAVLSRFLAQPATQPRERKERWVIRVAIKERLQRVCRQREEMLNLKSKVTQVKKDRRRHQILDARERK